MYDGLRRLLSIEEDGKPDTKIAHSYDKVDPGLPTATFTSGRRVKTTFPGGAIHYSYNTRGNVALARRTLMGVTFDFASIYNNTNSQLSYTFPNGTKQAYTYDLGARITAVAGKIDGVTYEASGAISSWKAANCIQTSYKYSNVERLQQIDVGAGKVMTLDYTLDSRGNINTWNQKHGSSSFAHTYSYDSIYRLTKADVANSAEVITVKQDDLHNLTEKISSLGDKSIAHIGSYSYDPKRVHAATQIGTLKLAYDASGQTIQQGDWKHDWDFLGRRTQTSKGGTVVGRYWYDHSRRRVVREENGLHTFYINKQYEIREGAVVTYVKVGEDRFAGTWTVKGTETFFDDLAPATGAQQLQPQPDGAITAADAWLYHANRNKVLQVASVKTRPVDLDLTQDMLESATQRMLLGADTEVTHYYHVDHLGSVRAITNATGNVVQRTHYYPYGSIREQTGDTSLFSYGYQGSEWDSATRTNYYGLRSLDPKSGRWLTPDPVYAEINGLTDEFNSYGMVLNNPIRMRDIQGGLSVDQTALNVLIGVGTAAVVGGIATGVGIAVHIRNVGRKADAANQAARGARNINFAELAPQVTPGGGDDAPRRSSASLARPEAAVEARGRGRSGSGSIARPDTPGGTPGRASVPGAPAALRSASIAVPATPLGPGTAGAIGEPDVPEPGFQRRRGSSVEGFARPQAFSQVEGFPDRRRSSAVSVEGEGPARTGNPYRRARARSASIGRQRRGSAGRRGSTGRIRRKR
ncbi:MAG: hypothetical protein EP343_20825 [Deltaproteobacteria bacterium]|nr:MAG: hypothetical protein EP343_20825 [Deltaproteobacteria bacterium]